MLTHIIILNPKKKKADQFRCEENSENEETRKKVKNTSWAKLLYRIFQIDVGTCKECGEQMEIACAVFDSSSVRRYLSSVGLLRGPPEETGDKEQIVYTDLLF